MNKILSTTLDPKNWFEAFLDNKRKYPNHIVEALEFINKQNLSGVTIREFEHSVDFTFEYEKWDHIPKCVRDIIRRKETDETYVPSFRFAWFDVNMHLYDASEDSEFSYEEFMHSLGRSDKKYICIDIYFD